MHSPCTWHPVPGTVNGTVPGAVHGAPGAAGPAVDHGAGEVQREREGGDRQDEHPAEDQQDRQDGRHRARTGGAPFPMISFVIFLFYYLFHLFIYF